MRRINALGYNGINALATSTFASRRKRPRAPRRVPQPVPQRSHAPAYRLQTGRGRTVCPADSVRVHG